jgi:hypothetical protein
MTNRIKPNPESGRPASSRHADDTEAFGGGRIEVRHGRINGWLLVVYLVLFLWALYYLYTQWGGLGPGLDY